MLQFFHTATDEDSAIVTAALHCQSGEVRVFLTRDDLTAAMTDLQVYYISLHCANRYVAECTRA
jgi:hypothetical protein